MSQTRLPKKKKKEKKKEKEEGQINIYHSYSLENSH